MKTQWWTENLSEVCAQFQLDLSSLIDGELESEPAAWSAMRHIEDCDCCRDFFEDAGRQVRMHRDISDPDRLIEYFTLLTGRRESESVELVHKLATIFYEVGKAYVLAASEPDLGVRALEKAVEVEPAKSWGRGFVDGIIARNAGEAESAGVDWQEARHILNGRLSRIDGALEKGKRLLRESLQADPSFDPARLYLGFVLYNHENKQLAALTEFKRVFEEGQDPINRVHAAGHLARMYFEEGDMRRAIIYRRWVTISGLVEDGGPFYSVLFGIGMYYAYDLKPKRALSYWRQLLDRFPERLDEVRDFFKNAPTLRARIDAQPGFGEALMATCPELFSSDQEIGDLRR